MAQLSQAAAATNLPQHHLSDELLLDYAAGTLSEPMALMAAAHLTLCPVCRAAQGRLEAVGGALLDGAAPAEMSEGALERMLARLDLSIPAPAARPVLADGGIPRPLLAYLPDSLDNLPWHKVMSGLYEYRLPIQGHQGMASLLRISPGKSMPKHTHKGHEATVVLRGGFEDASGHFVVGDVAMTDESIDHQPTADDGVDCICYAVTDAPLKLTGTFGRLLNPFISI